ncbi:MAG: adenylate/guanylate cyclase domain-containing protein [Candidatus Marinimicrobia bacterium]|nr:adenylate/guanylate cyclase domain-containing protein [Candidatus Neomarinimicrobiota bacterium]MCF7828865.1 adenylate/guanylate cyclase domain-containing protein [Candidatus Neomarinimicrobiota bacterium]MCF7880782.1 adenylate/guanylate cyclase domain-containing protein [Candidatus Neomarinimicrobiota bacterium]
MNIPGFLNSVTNQFTKTYRTWYVALGIALVLSLVAMALNNLAFMREIEQKTLDYRFVQFPIPERADSNIVLVDIDNNSLEYFGETVGIQYPFPRNFYALMNSLFKDVNSRAVMYDMLFYDPDLNRDETYADQTDGAFAESIRDHGKVILGCELLVDSSGGLIPKQFGIPIEGKNDLSHIAYQGAKVPIDTLLHAAAGLGITNVHTDQDGVLRRTRPLFTYRSKTLASLPIRGWIESGGFGEIRTDGQKIRAGDQQIPLDENGEYLVNWYGPGGPEGAFQYVPISAVIQTASALRYGGEPSLDPEMFRDKYIIVGASAAGLKDLKPTPFTGITPYPGMEIWATVLSNFTQGDFVHRMPAWLTFLNTMLIAFLAYLAFTQFRMRYSHLLLPGIALFLVGLSLLLWNTHRIWMEIVFPATGFVLSYVTAATLSFVMEGRSKLEIRKVFSRYVHPDVIQNLLREPDMVQMGGDEIYATVLFSDIYNFTTFSEGKSAPELVQYLNEYFDKLTSFVLDHNGLLDKYTGDGIMALFGAPLPRDDHAVLACQAALAHREFAYSLTSNGESVSPAAHFHRNTRIGLNSGPIVAGNIGSERRTDYTAIGDDVNLAARLEGVNKVFKTQIIISESTYALVKEEFLCRELDLLRVKGKTEPVKIYELIDRLENATRHNTELYKQYHEGLLEYRNGNWKAAISIFGELAVEPYNDSPSQTMLERSQVLKKEKPKEWDGVFTLTSK